MVRFEVKGKWYKIPKRLSPRQWASLAQLDLKEPLVWPKALAMVTGAPLPALVASDPRSLELGMGFLIALMSERQRTTDHLPFSSITFGQWVDLDIWLVWGIDSHLEDILGILAPQCKTASEALYIIEKYARWRLSVYKQYSALFGLDEPSDEDRNGDKMAVARGWYAVMVKLAQGDILKLDPVAEQPLKKTLNLLAYQKQIELEERAQALQMKRQYDLQRNSRSLR